MVGALLLVQGAAAVAVGATGTAADLATWTAKTVAVPASDVAYDGSRDVLLVTVPSTNSSLGNELVELDPETGAIGRHVAVGSDPGVIALTDDGTTAYVGLLGVNRLARVDLATFTVVSSWPTTSDSFFGPRYVEDLEAVPGRNDLVLASLMKPGFSPRHEGVWAFRDGVPLPDHTQSHTGSDRIEIASPTTAYGYNNETTEFGFRRLALSATGVTEVDAGSSPITGFGVDIELASGRVHSTSGLVVDPATRSALGSYGTSGLLEVTPSDGRTTFLSGTTVSVFDELTTVALGQRSFAIPSTATTLVASGTGFAAGGPDGVTLLGPSVVAGAVALPPPPSSISAGFAVVVAGVAARDLVYDDLRRRLYASVPSSAPAHANEVVAIDPESGALVGSVFIGSDPGPLALTDDGSRLFVGQSSIGRLVRVDLSTFSVSSSFALGNSSLGGPLVAEDIEVQPGTTDAVAVSLRNTCCSPRHEGDAIYSGGSRLATSTPGHTGANRIEFATPTTLYGTNNETTGFEFYGMAVSPTGVSRTSTTGYLLPGFGTDIDLTGGLVYATTGAVVDPGPAELVGRYAGGGAVEADVAADRVWFASSTSLEEFQRAKFTPVGSRNVDFGSTPTALVRTPFGLAAATPTKVVVLTTSTAIVPPPVVSGVSPSSGSTDGGTTVTISGSGFSNATGVRFGGVAASSWSVTNDAQITARTPAHAAGAVEVRVDGLSGSGARAGAFTYTAPAPPPSPNPSPGPTTGTGNGVLSVSRGAIDWGEQRVHTYDPEPEVVQVRNTGTAPVAVTGIELAGDQVWGGGTTCAAGRPLAPGEVCAIAAFFVPDSARSFRGEFRIFGSNGSVARVTLTGRGVVGYFVATASATLRGFGDAWPTSAAVGGPLTRPVVGMATTPNGGGQWMVATDGGIFSFGDAEFFGSTGAMRLNQPIVGMAATPTGEGYWLVASDGGIFSFGDAEFLGSTGAMRLNQPIVGMATTGTGSGYWFVARDGGIFSFGDAKFFGSTGAIRLNQPIVGMAASPTGQGYWFTARDGGIFNFGDAPFLGSAAPSPEPVVAVAGTAPVYLAAGVPGLSAAAAGVSSAILRPVPGRFLPLTDR